MTRELTPLEEREKKGGTIYLTKAQWRRLEAMRKREQYKTLSALLEEAVRWFLLEYDTEEEK